MDIDRARQNQRLAEEEFKQGKVRLDSLPPQITLYTTDTCNLRCIMCNIGQRVGPKITITPEGYQRIFDTFPLITSVVLSGAEMLYDKGNPAGYVQRIFDEGEKHPHLKFAGVTNGTLITNERARIIVDSFSWINVSLDTTDPEQYAKIRVGANFRSVKRNLERIRDLKRERGLKPEDSPRVGLCFIIMEKTYTKILEMADLGKELDAHWVQFQAPWEGTLQDEDIFSDKNKIEKYLYLRETVEGRTKDTGLTIIDRTHNSITRNFPEMREQLCISQKKIIGKWPDSCNVPYKEAYIDFRGNVRVCCTSPTVLGNINDAPFREIWNSAIAIEMRQRLLAGDYSQDCGENCVKGFLLPGCMPLPSR